MSVHKWPPPRRTWKSKRAWAKAKARRFIWALERAIGKHPVYRTKSGRILTDAEIELLSEEAERGYDIEHLKKGEKKK